MTEQREQQAGRTTSGDPDRTQALPRPDLRAAAGPATAQRERPGAPEPGPGDVRGGSVPAGARGTDRVPRTAAAGEPAGPTAGSAKQRRARLRLRRVDPASVFTLALLVSLFLAVALVIAVVALYVVLEAAGVPASVNELVGEITRAPGEVGAPAPLLTAGRALTAAGIVAVLDVVLLTALATLGAVLYNLCASFTGGVEVTLAEDER